MTDESKAKALAEAEAKAQRWFLVVLLALVGVGALALAPLLRVRSLGAWQQAVDRAVADERVKASLGEPITAEWSYDYEYAREGPEVRLQIPLVGDRRNGALFVKGVETGGVWGFSELRLLADDGTVIKLVQ